MTIHDDARAAGEKVYDAALAEISGQVTARDRTIADQTVTITNLTDLRGQAERARDTALSEASVARQTVAERDELIAQLRARVAELTSGPGIPVKKRGPQTFKSMDEARAAAERGDLRAPLDANWVELPAGQTITAFGKKLGPNDLLVIPAGRTEALLDASKGFLGTGDVAQIWNGAEIVSGKPVEGTGTKYPVTAGGMWLAMARVTRGILGLGPVVVKPSETSWRAPQQIRNGADATKGIPKRGQFHISSTGRVSTEKVGAQEKLIESSTDRPYFGNFILEGADLGGICYHGITTSRAEPIFENLLVRGGWRSAGVSPNVETSALGLSSGTGYKIINCWLDGQGKGSTPIMINQGTHGGEVTDTLIEHGIERSGPAAHYAVGGTHTWRNVTVNDIGGPNIENTLEGFTFRAIGCDWTGMRADRQISLGYPQQKVTIEIIDTPLSAASKGVLGVNRWDASPTNKGNRDNTGISYVMDGAIQQLSIRQ